MNPNPTHGPSTTVATTGSTLNTDTTTAQAGAGVFYLEGNPRNKSLRLPLTFPQTNQAAGLIAIKITIEENKGAPNLYIESDSKYAINALTRNLAKHENQGYIGMANAEILQATTAALRNREGKTMLKWVKSNPQHQGITGAKQMANLGAQKNQADEVELAIEPAYQLKGAKLSEIKGEPQFK